MWKEAFVIFLSLLIRSTIAYDILDTPHITELEEHEADYILEQGGGLWSLLFFVSKQGASEAAFPAFKQASNMMLGLVKFGIVDVNRYPVLAHRFDIRKVPSIVFIDKDLEETKYTGPLTDKGIIEFSGKLLMQQVEYGMQKRLSNNRRIKELTDGEVLKYGKNGTKFWLIAFYSSKDNVTRFDFIKMVEYASETFKNSINVGAFDITKRSTPYMYDEVPTVVLFHGKKSDRYEIEYNDKFYGNMLVSFVMARIKTPQVQELWTETILTEMCQLKKYCMLTFIPAVPKCDTDCKDKYKGILAEVAEDYKTMQAGWAVIRHGVMKTAEKMFDITADTQLPIFIVVEVKTLKSEYLTEKFDAVNIKTFITEILEGEGFTGRTIPIFEHLPRYKPWLRDEL